MSPLSFLILSDIHFGEFAVSPDFRPDRTVSKHDLTSAVSMRDDLTKKLKSTRIAGVFVLGDLTAIATPSEFDSCKTLISGIASELGVSTDNVFYTFGNHDVDWRISQLADKTETFPGDLLYKPLAACVASLFVSNPAATEAGPLPGSGVFQRDTFTLYILNSGHLCVHDQAYKHGKLGAEQLDWFKKELLAHAHRDAWHILMLHHHPRNYPYPTLVEDISCLQEGAELQALIGQHGIDFVCHGHRHHPKLFTAMIAGWKHPTTFFCAGSLAVNETHRCRGQIPNMFHVLHLDTQTGAGAAVGRVSTYEYRASEGWIPAAYSKEVPLDAEQHFGVFAAELDLKALMESLIKATLGANGASLKELPTHNQLQAELRCMHIHALNNMVLESAAALGVSVIGKYPDAIAVIPKRKHE